MYLSKTVGVVVPACNEAAAIAAVVHDLRAVRHGTTAVIDAIVVCANACTDQTAELAAAAGASVVLEPRRGYGRACLRGMAALPPVDYIAFIDGDRACVAAELIDLLDACCAGADLAIGSRALGTAEPGALLAHQRLGNYLASRLLRLLWRSPVTDLGPLRVVRSTILARLAMCELTFGWTAEMQVKALALGYRVAERPVTSLRRIGQSKVSGTVAGSFGAAWGIFSTIARYARFRG